MSRLCQRQETEEFTEFMKEWRAFLLTQGLAGTTQGPISSQRSSVGHAHFSQAQISHCESFTVYR